MSQRRQNSGFSTGMGPGSRPASSGKSGKAACGLWPVVVVRGLKFAPNGTPAACGSAPDKISLPRGRAGVGVFGTGKWACSSWPVETPRLASVSVLSAFDSNHLPRTMHHAPRTTHVPTSRRTTLLRPADASRGGGGKASKRLVASGLWKHRNAPAYATCPIRTAHHVLRTKYHVPLHTPPPTSHFLPTTHYVLRTKHYVPPPPDSANNVLGGYG